MWRVCLLWCCYKWQIPKSQGLRKKSLFSSCETFHGWIFTRKLLCNCLHALIQDLIIPSNLHLSGLQHTTLKITLFLISLSANPWVKENEESSIVRTCPQIHVLALGMCLNTRNLTNTVKSKGGWWLEGEECMVVQLTFSDKKKFHCYK